MYSGTTLTSTSGRLVGAHQKIDRVARRHLKGMLHSEMPFPGIKTILHFEGRNGPDGIKRKSPAQDEPWHYFSPFDEDDRILVGLIDDHYRNLVHALQKNDSVVAGFEAAWLAHAIVDGLTPAHHYPYEKELDELRGGLGKETRVTIKDKVVMPGSNNRETIKNNWKMWGPKGLLTTHFAFEWGVASLLIPMRLAERTEPSRAEMVEIQSIEATDYFVRLAKEVAAFGIYDAFYKHGWTSGLARTVRQQLIPALVKAVTLIWYKASCDAAGINGSIDSGTQPVLLTASATTPAVVSAMQSPVQSPIQAKS
jgi:hypothetical protein